MRIEDTGDVKHVRRASSMSGMPSRRASFMRVLKHSMPIMPSPMLSCRSFLLPSGFLDARRSQHQCICNTPKHQARTSRQYVAL